MYCGAYAPQYISPLQLAIKLTKAKARMEHMKTNSTPTGSKRNLTQVTNGDVARYVRLRPLKDTETTDGIYVALSAGQTLSGVYKGNAEGNFGKKNYTIQTTDTELPTIISGSGNLGARMSQVPEGAYVEITYGGKNMIKSGPYKGKEAHSFNVAFEKV